MNKKRFLRPFLGLVLLSVLFVGVNTYQLHQFTKTPLSIHNAENGVIFVIPFGTSLNQIANRLVDADLISSRFLFLETVYLTGNKHRLKAGEYWIKSGQTPLEFIQMLKDGKVIQYALTIVPGWTFERLMLEINASPKIQHTLDKLTPLEIMAQLGYPNQHPEGRFFPETYYYTANTPDTALLKRAYTSLQKILEALWARHETDPTALQFLKSPTEALILASIIEKESSLQSEYADIAGVYIRRLQKNMRLQADPTVIYGAKNYRGNITQTLLDDAENPYNTYQRLGLPPTPIALPSQKAIEAALYPASGDYLYFVAKKDGKGHVFSKTLTEHQAAVLDYRKR